MVWDKGTFEIGNGGLAAEELARGELKLILHGCKLKGGFALVRSYGGERSKWLLIKKRDEHADRSWSTAGQDWSVLTGRSMREIAEGAPARRKKAIRSEPARRKAG